MPNAFSRTELIIGKEGAARLASSTVAVVGVGGVGSWAAEALARAGIGGLVVVDHDLVCETNINRQSIALRSTVGRPKVEALRDRLLDINPDMRVEAIRSFYGPDTADGILRPGLAYVIDAIDTVSAKLDLIERAAALGIPIVSSMGAGNKLDPTRVEVADISDTLNCPLARVIRKRLRRRGIRHLRVVYSSELPRAIQEAHDSPGQANGCPEDGPVGAGGAARRSTPGSMSFVTPVFGFVAASVAIRDILGGALAP